MGDGIPRWERRKAHLSSLLAECEGQSRMWLSWSAHAELANYKKMFHTQLNLLCTCWASHPGAIEGEECEHWRPASISTAAETWEMIEVSGEMGRSGLEESRREQKKALWGHDRNKQGLIPKANECSLQMGKAKKKTVHHRANKGKYLISKM